MKTIIISDIKGNGDSIIAYGLNLAKSLESEVDIIHIIDSRAQQGVQSSFSDSQTIAPEKKMSHQEIVDREKDYAGKELDRILSGEASRLNYPLKINTIIEEGSVVNKLNEHIKNEDQCLLIANAKHDNFIFRSRQELVETMRCLESIFLLVPSGYTFDQIKNIVLVPDFTSKDVTLVRDKISFLENFKPQINAVHVAKQNNPKQTDLKNRVVEELIDDRLTPFTFEMNILTGNNYTETITDYINKTDPDLVLMVRNKKTLFKRLLQKEKNEKLLENINHPVLLVK